MKVCVVVNIWLINLNVFQLIITYYSKCYIEKAFSVMVDFGRLLTMKDLIGVSIVLGLLILT